MDKVLEVKSELDKMEPCLVDEVLVEEKEAKSRVPRLDTDSAKVTCEAMAEKVKDEVVARRMRRTIFVLWQISSQEMLGRLRRSKSP